MKTSGGNEGGANIMNVQIRRLNWYGHVMLRKKHYLGDGNRRILEEEEWKAKQGDNWTE